MSGAGDVERLLRRALAPVDPPEDLVGRLRNGLQTISDAAADELEGWERAAIRDPRRWVRPGLAVIAGGTAGIGLFVLGALRRRSRD